MCSSSQSEVSLAVSVLNAALDMKKLQNRSEIVSEVHENSHAFACIHLKLTKKRQGTERRIIFHQSMLINANVNGKTHSLPRSDLYLSIVHV